jgi:hypothetical protein
MKRYFSDFILFFIGGMVMVLPLQYHLISFHEVWIENLFGTILIWLKSFLFNYKTDYNEITSDSSSMYALFFLVFCLAILFTFLVQLIPYWKIKREKIMLFLKVLATYFLSLQMLKYGLTKLTKGQFYIPEPNILYTNFGALDKDILYWSTIGTSYSYNLFLGVVEIVAGVLLLHKKTRFFGALIAVGIMTNVFMVNMSFDISVKLLSSFLLLIAIVLSFKNGLNIIKVFTGKNEVIVLDYLTIDSNKAWKKQLIKGAIVCLLLLETCFPVIQHGNFNDDNYRRSYLHGAYEVIGGGKNDLQFDQLFIHRKGYLIFKKGEEMTDFHLEIDQSNRNFILTGYEHQQTIINYKKTDSLLYLKLNENNSVKLKELNWEELPALKTQFHWMVD